MTYAFHENTKATHHQLNATIVLQTRIQTKPRRTNAKFVMLQQDPMPVPRFVQNVKKVNIYQIQLKHVQHVQQVTPASMGNLNAVNVD